MSQLSEDYSQFVVPTYGRFDLDIEGGAGCRVWDFEGREYLDFFFGPRALPAADGQFVT